MLLSIKYKITYYYFIITMDVTVLIYRLSYHHILSVPLNFQLFY